jgi:hypothetical protein
MHSVHGSNFFGGVIFTTWILNLNFHVFLISKSHVKKNPRLPTICWRTWHIIRGFLLWCFSTLKFLHAVDGRRKERPAKDNEPLVGSLPDGSWQLAHAVFEVGISTRRAKIARSAFSFRTRRTMTNSATQVFWHSVGDAGIVLG